MTLKCVRALLIITCLHKCSSMTVARRLAPEIVIQTAQNIFAICGHLQNPDLYSTIWADAASVSDQNGLIAARDVTEGEILSLFPVHAVGLKGFGRTKMHDIQFFDDDIDGDFFRTSKRSKHQMLVPEEATFNNQLFVDVNPVRPSLPGWLGHLVSVNDDYANCQIVPLAPPICALVATTSVAKGKVLFQGRGPIPSRLSDVVQKRYHGEIVELESYLRMAHPKENDDSDLNETNGNPGMPFYAINRHYPGIKILASDPEVLEVDNFLSSDECDRLIAKARPNLKPCVTKNPSTGAVEMDPDRTSTNANIPQREVPAIVSKILHLANCDASQLEILQVLHYEKGQRFTPHTDGFRGPTTACGFENSGRLVTIFCYLNTVAKGGETRFTELGLDIKPSKGKAVIHFPATVGLEEDPRTEHEGAPTIDEKWLLVTWVWMNSRTDPQYAESNLPSLSSDII